MDIFVWIGLGLVAGILGKMILPGKDPGGWIITILLGIAGAWVGGWLGSKLGLGGVSGFNAVSILTATAGSVILLFLYRMVKSK